MKLIKKSEHRLICQSNSFLIWMMGGLMVVGFGLVLIISKIESSTDCLKIVCNTGMLLERGGTLLMGILLIFAGIFTALMVPRTRTIIDLNLNQIEIEKKWIFLNKTEKIEHSLSDICSVEVEVYRDDDGATYRVAFLDKLGTSIPLSYDYSGDKKLNYEIADKLRQFLRI
jgi:hypothetical protein